MYYIQKAVNASQHRTQTNDDCLSEILTHQSGLICPSAATGPCATQQSVTPHLHLSSSLFYQLCVHSTANALNYHVFRLLSILLTMFFFSLPALQPQRCKRDPWFSIRPAWQLAIHLISFFRIYARRLSKCGADQTPHYRFKELKVSIHHFTARSNKIKAFQDQGPLVKMQFIMPCAVSKEERLHNLIKKMSACSPR